MNYAGSYVCVCNQTGYEVRAGACVLAVTLSGVVQPLAVPRTVTRVTLPATALASDTLLFRVWQGTTLRASGTAPFATTSFSCDFDATRFSLAPLRLQVSYAAALGWMWLDANITLYGM